MTFFELLTKRCREADSLLCVGLDPHGTQLPEGKRNAEVLNRQAMHRRPSRGVLWLPPPQSTHTCCCTSHTPCLVSHPTALLCPFAGRQGFLPCTHRADEGRRLRLQAERRLLRGNRNLC